MKRVLVSYKVKQEKLADNRKFIDKVFEELHERRPEDLRYASFVLDDGLSFVHVASIETTDGSNPLADMTAFKAFIEQIHDRCESEPVVVELDVIGSYRLFGE